VIEGASGAFLRFLEKVAGPVGERLFDRYRRFAIRRDIRRGLDNKFHILISKLADDTVSHSFRATLYETIRYELEDAVQLTNWPEVESHRRWPPI
jgi:hypothetical protein